MSIVRSFLLSLLILVLPSAPAAADDQALAMVQNASEEILTRLSEKPQDERDLAYVRSLIEKILLPELAQQTIAERVLGEYWQAATAAQRQRFTEEFRRYMVSFYSEVFRAYSGEKVSYQLGDVSSPNCCTVVSNIYQQNGRAIEARYRLERRSNDWKVTDVIVDGISMVRSNRQQYSYLVSRKGLDQVIDMLQQRNDQQRR